ncbi:MAG TPA: IclR family transcriptional regulator [Chloroflexi bacterium]|nr:IclR family transcriptional regulator [Chloroflexota bacterium]
MPNYRIAVVEDAIAVLDAFLQVDGALSLVDLTHHTGLSKNKVFRILATLEAHRLVRRDGHGKYLLGLRFLEFGERARSRDILIQAASSVMDWLCDETQETIFLGIIDGLETLVIATRQSPRSVRLTGDVGRRGPMHTGGMPKTLLAFLPDDKRKAMLDQLKLEPITPYTITDREELEAFLEKIRQQGYVVTADDLDLGAVSIAAPIRDFTGEVIAAMSIAGPVSRFPEEVTRRYVKLILEATRRVSVALGYRPDASHGLSVPDGRHDPAPDHLSVAA